MFFWRNRTLLKMDKLMSQRYRKLERIRELGIHPYPDRYERTHSLKEVMGLGEGERVRVCGRLTALRQMGGLVYGDLQDMEGRVQVSFARNNFVDFDRLLETVDIGDFLGVEGILYRTKRGELTVDASGYTFLGKALRPLPTKWHGLQDRELCYRQRYLDLIMSAATRERFLFRSRLVQVIRRFLEDHHFLEVETPVLINKPSGALATPFRTHHNALDIDVYLRIAPETYLKRLIVGGFDRIFEFARCFRNEGMDPTHLQDFTMLEYYCAYWNYEDNMKFTEKLMVHLLRELAEPLARLEWYNEIQALKRSGRGKEALKLFRRGPKKPQPLKVRVLGEEIDFTPPWPRVSLRDLILRDCGLDIDEYPEEGDLRRAIQGKGIELEGIEGMGRGKMIDTLYKKVSRPGLLQPTFITSHPLELSPLARKSDANPEVVDRFQLVVMGAEIVNAYSELVDPLDQRARLEEQARLHQRGDEEAMVMDEDYLLCMEYGMPPISGWGMGIDRVVALLSGQENLRDVIFFPLMKPLELGD
ncbi:MAG: lysine--tRNA ligase [Planctomycetota bacterium]|nr:MAG: lysine--tRNA ligase [Planctomycetota bacterium]